MEGVETNNNRGISYRTIQKIFHLLNLKQQQERAAQVLLQSQDGEGGRKDFTFGMEIGMLEAAIIVIFPT